MNNLGMLLNIIYPVVVIITIISGGQLIYYILKYIYTATTDYNIYYNYDGTYFELASLFETIKFLNNLLEDDKIKISFAIIPNKEIFKDVKKSEIPKNLTYILDKDSVIIRILKYDNVATYILFRHHAILNNIYFQYFKFKLKRRTVLD